MTEEEIPASATATFALFLNSDTAVKRLPDASPPSVEASAEIKEKLSELSDQKLQALLADTAAVLVSEYPTLAAVQQQALDSQDVRGIQPHDVDAVRSMLEFLRASPAFIILIAVALRIVGDNRVKFGKFELKTGSVLKDLAGVIKLWK